MDRDCECPSCKATGIYRGLMEPLHIGVVCTLCQGSGKVIAESFPPFNGRKIRNDEVRLVYLALSDKRGIYIGTPVTVDQFYAGEMPSGDVLSDVLH